MRLAGDAAAPRLVTVRSGIDHTDRMHAWAEAKVGAIEKLDLCAFCLSRAGHRVQDERGKGYTVCPECRHIPVSASLRECSWNGSLLFPWRMKAGFNDPSLREISSRGYSCSKVEGNGERQGSTPGNLSPSIPTTNFSYSRTVPNTTPSWGDLLPMQRNRKGRRSSTIFHCSHGPVLSSLLPPEKIRMCLQHIAGYFRKQLSSEEKQELLGVIESYHYRYCASYRPPGPDQSYVRKYDEPYVKQQYYLHPHPAELMLRNHV